MTNDNESQQPRIKPEYCIKGDRQPTVDECQKLINASEIKKDARARLVEVKTKIFVEESLARSDYEADMITQLTKQRMKPEILINGEIATTQQIINVTHEHEKILNTLVKEREKREAEKAKIVDKDKTSN